LREGGDGVEFGLRDWSGRERRMGHRLLIEEGGWVEIEVEVIQLYST